MTVAEANKESKGIHRAKNSIKARYNQPSLIQDEITGFFELPNDVLHCQ
jgi:hypothetical protein